MKKKLLVLPVLAGLMLTGCKITLFGKTFYLFEKKPEEEEKQKQTTDHLKMEFGDYKLATSVKDGGRYLLGVYRTREKIMRFANGYKHEDEKGDYPFYMETVENTTEGAAEVEVKMLNNKEFTLQVFAEGTPWHEKYIGIYCATSSYKNKVCSIAMLDSYDQTEYSYTSGSGSGTAAEITGKFQYVKEFENFLTYAPAACAKFDFLQDIDVLPKFMGTGHANEGDDYTSIDSRNAYAAIDAGTYDLAHLYEHK